MSCAATAPNHPNLVAGRVHLSQKHGCRRRHVRRGHLVLTMHCVQSPKHVLMQLHRARSAPQDLQQDVAAPLNAVSYTHLTLPTICSV